MSSASASPVVARVARALAGRGVDGAPAPPLRWALEGALSGGAIRSVEDRGRAVLAPVLPILDAIARPLAARPLLVAAAALLALPLARLALPADGVAPVAASLLALFALSTVLGLASSLHEGAERAIVLRVLLAGFALRAALLLVIAWRGPFPDEYGVYHVLASDAAGSWSIGGSSLLTSHPVAHHREAYLFLLAWTYHLGGADMILGRVLGAGLGLLAALLAGEIARALAGNRAALLAVVLLALHPEHAFWSITLSRDTLTTVLVLTTLVLVLRRRGRLLGVGGLLAAVPLTLLAANSFPLAGTLGATLVCVAAGEAACAARWTPRGVLLPGVVVVGAVGTLVLVGHSWGAFFTPELFSAVRGLAIDAQADFLPGLRLESFLDVLLFAPLGALFVLFAPFPWAAAHPQRTAYGTAALVGHAVTLLGIAGLWHAARRRPAAAAPVVLFLLLSLALFGVLEGQSGIVVRHRLPLTALFAVGAAVLLAGRVRTEDA